MAADHRIEEAAVDRFAFTVELDPSGFGQAVFVWIQATDAVGQRFGQHRDRPVGKVDAGGAGVGLLVQCRVRANVMGDVGDGDEKLVAAALAAYVDRVVEIAGVFAVDGDDGQIAQVFAPGDFCRADFEGGAHHFAVHFGWKARRQIEAEDDRLRLDLGIVRVAHHLHQSGFRRRHGGAEAADLGGDDFTLGQFRAGALERHGADARVHRDQESSAVDFLVGAKQPLLAAFDDLDDMSFAAAALFAIDAHDHLIAMHDPAHLAAVQINVLGIFVFENEKAVAVGMGVDAAAQEILPVGQGVVIFLEPHEAAVAAELAQAVDDRL